jgi:hypothetical protein
VFRTKIDALGSPINVFLEIGIHLPSFEVVENRVFQQPRLFTTVTMKTNRWTLVALAILICGLLSWAMVWRTKQTIKRDSRELLATVEALSQSRDFAGVRRKYGTRLRQLPHCDQSDCSYEIVISNKLLAMVHLSSYAEIRARFDVSRADVITSMLDYRTAPSGEAGSIVHVQTDYSCAATCSYFYVHPWQDTGLNLNRATPWEGASSNNGIVEFGYATNPVNRKAALSLNLECLTGAERCTNISQLLPTLWTAVHDDLVRCPIPNETGKVE